MNRALALTLALTCALFSGLAHAQDDDEESETTEFARSGLYLAGYGVWAISAYRSEPGGFYGASPGAKFKLGYRVSPVWAFEADIEWIQRFYARLDGSRRDTWSVAGGFNLKAYLSDGRFQPYGLVGANGYSINTRTVQDDGTVLASDSNLDWGLRFGAGLDVYATEHLAIGLEASYMWGIITNWDYDYASFGVGATWRF